MKNSITEQLTNCLKGCLSAYGESDDVSPEVLAACAIKKLDPDQKAPPAIEWGCNLELREMSRKLLRRTYGPGRKEEDSPQNEMFENLQDRYPATRNGECVYVPRMNLTVDERLINVGRLMSEAEVKTQHANALQEETSALIDAGYFEDNQESAKPSASVAI